MIIVSYQQAKSFLSVMQEILEENESANSLMLGVSMSVRDQPELFTSPVYLRTTHNTDGLLAAAVQTPPKALLLYNDRPGSAGDSLWMFAADLSQNHWNPSGVLAECDLADRFAHYWSVVTGTQTRLAIRERLYECNEVRYQPEASGSLREPAPEEFPLLVEWAQGMETELGLPEAGANTKGRIKHLVQAKSCFVWADGTHPVSMVLKTRPTRHTISISGVYTPPSLRNRGYASAAVSALTRRLLESGYRNCNLFTDLSNPTSNAIYQRIGYIPVMDYNYHQFTQLPLEQ
ncbi:MAG: GNAT family N-acetyltransferase [Anaerolineae bacterium]|nr:GNAT family N-acetyltransferase [Anaerolineae bacterium]